MYAGQTLRDENGYEVALMPMDKLGVTQGEHSGQQLAIDFGYDSQRYPSGEMPYYAPVTCRCVAIFSDYIIWTSVNQVHTPLGITYLSWQFGHDYHLSDHYVGEVVNQGQLIGYMGNKGTSSGYHLHFSAINAPSYNYVGNHLYNLFYVNGTEIVVSGGYNWQTYTGPTPTQYRVTLNVSPSGSGYTTGQGLYNSGELAVLRAYANEGYRFVRWNDGYNVWERYWTITQDLTLTAYFELIPQDKGHPSFNYNGTEIRILH